MCIIYDLIFLVILIFYLPVYLVRRKFHSEFWARLGFLPKGLSLTRPIWIHAVSVGEAMAVRGLVEELRREDPKAQFVITTVTVTGNKIAKNIARTTDLVTYLPLDLSFIVRHVIRKINPSMVILAETEIWPNLISALYKKKIPVITVNGRISDSSFRGYRMTKFLISPILKKVNLFCVQTERDAERLRRLGVVAGKVLITGNMKFDSRNLAADKKNSVDLRAKLNILEGEKLLLAGSTHPGEEESVLRVLQALQKEFSGLRLLIAPRHPERAKDVEQVISEFGFKPLKISQLGRQDNAVFDQKAVFILDTVGELVAYYAIADIVFVGGSLVKTGGHNILEPASLGKPVFFGPHMFNFRDIAEVFLARKAAVRVCCPEELEVKIAALLRDAEYAKRLSQAALELISENQGATKRNIEFIRTFKE